MHTSNPRDVQLQSHTVPRITLQLRFSPLLVRLGSVLLLTSLITGVVLTGRASADEPAEPSEETEATSPEYDVVSLRGRIVFYGPALKESLGIQLVPEANERTLAIETPAGQLIPIVEDLRGRALRTDERLRQMDVELLVRQYHKTPTVQILRMYQWQDGQKYRVDYWCDVCAIVMFETGPCSCCQDHNRLRRRTVDLATGNTGDEADPQIFDRASSELKSE